MTMLNTTVDKFMQNQELEERIESIVNNEAKRMFGVMLTAVALQTLAMALIMIVA